MLAESMHEVLSTVAAIRSTADILVRRDRPRSGLARPGSTATCTKEAERLSTRATALLGHSRRRRPRRRGRPASTPIETVEAMFEGAGHHFPMIEAEGEAAIPVVLEGAAGMDDPATRTLGARWLRAYAADAAAPAAGRDAARGRSGGV